MNSNSVIEVVAGVIWHGDKFLAAQRIRGSHSGFWEFPGGKIELGESPIQALYRELEEELDIKVEEAKLWRTVMHEYDIKTVRLFVFNIYKYNGVIRAVEGNPLLWLTAQDAKNIEFLAADAPLIDEMLS